MDERDKLRRLSQRGVLTIEVKFEAKVLTVVTDSETFATTSTYAEVDEPVWYGVLDKHRRSYPESVTTRIGAFVWDQFGMNSWHAKAATLNELLDELLDRSRPPHFDPATDYCPGQPVPA